MTDFVSSPFTPVFAWWFFAAFVGGMPEPRVRSSLWYKWLYRSLNLLAANIEKARGGR